MLFFLQVNLILLCLIGNAFFAGIETGMISINRLKLRPHVEEEKQWALRIQAFLDNSGRMLGTTLVGTNLCMIMGSILAASLLDSLSPRYGEFLAGVIMTVIVLVFCEYTPKAWFRAHPIERSRHFIGALEMLARLFMPVIKGVTMLTDWVVRDPEGRVTRSPVMTRDDLIVLTQESTENGLLTPKQRIMILRVADLSETTPPACMVPRAKMVHLSSDATVAEFYALARDSGRSSIPLHASEGGEFVGLAHLYDILPLEPADSTVPISRYLKPALFVKHNAPLTELFPLMRRARQTLCLVVGPRGDVTGLLTTEDILRLVVGSL
jgi:putative hemolysin